MIYNWRKVSRGPSATAESRISFTDELREQITAMGVLFTVSYKKKMNSYVFMTAVVLGLLLLFDGLHLGLRRSTSRPSHYFTTRAIKIGKAINQIRRYIKYIYYF